MLFEFSVISFIADENYRLSCTQCCGHSRAIYVHCTLLPQINHESMQVYKMDTRNYFCQSSLENTLVYTLQVVPTKTNPSGISREQILRIFNDQCGPR